MSLHQIIARRRRALLDSFVRGFPPLVEVESAAGLGSLLHLDEFLPGSITAAIGRRSTGNVVMVAGPLAQPDAATVWVRAGYRDYKGAYLAFIRANYGLDVTRADIHGFDIDHLLKSARAGSETTLLRIEALSERQNRSWGGYLEKLASNPKIRANSKTVRLMSHLIAAKVAGLPPPSSLNDKAGRQALAVGLSRLGIPLHEVEGALANMLDHIARNQ